MKLEANEAVIITGGSGFVGTYIQAELRKHWKQAKIISWDLPDVDITKPETYKAKFKELQPSWVIHLAAIASVGLSLQKPELVREVNVEGTRKLLQSAKQNTPNTKFLVVSSADIYGSADNAIPELPLKACQPRNPYAQSKWEMERFIKKEHSSQVIRVRPFPHIGPGQQLGFVTADFASQIAAIEKSKQEPVIKVGNLEAERDFTHVKDTVRAYRLLMEKGKLGDVYNIASGKPVKIQDILNTLLSFSSVEIKVDRDPERMRPSDHPRIVGDASQLTQLTGWQPTIPLEQALREILDYWRTKKLR